MKTRIEPWLHILLFPDHRQQMLTGIALSSPNDCPRVSHRIQRDYKNVRQCVLQNAEKMGICIVHYILTHLGSNFKSFY